MDYSDFVLDHRMSGADITVAALPCDEKRATAFGLMKIDGTGRIVDFSEKPEGAALRAMQVRTNSQGSPGSHAACQGIACRTHHEERECLPTSY